ncbi:MAG: transketolase family protein [candidate division Zixibacteria bacterium]|nr:transketolase family protein [candidate division Zixibacteria bacterium]
MVVKERATVEKKKTRVGFGKALLELGRENPNVVAVTADVKGSVNVHYFAEEFPDRFINCGVAEQNACNISSGLALAGKIPYFAAYGCFATSRCLDMIRTTICYANLNVKIAGSHGGLLTGEDGASHQALEELGLMRVLPNMTVVIPCDYWEAFKATKAVSKVNGPCYLRLGRADVPVLTEETAPFELGKGVLMRDGSDVAIVACGAMVYEALRAADILSTEDVEAQVINIHTVKPIDRKILTDAAKKCGAIVAAEEHQIYCGLGSAVAEVVVRHAPVPMEFVGVNDQFGMSGKGPDLLVKFGLKDVNIADAVRKVIARKR